LKNIPVNQVITAEYSKARIQKIPADATIEPPLFQALNGDDDIRYRHDELDYVDFNLQKLLPHKLSQYGPALAVTDANGDGLEDLFIGGSSQRKGRFFIQKPDGKFEMQDLIADADSSAKIYEDMGVLFFDADSDGDDDLYIASGSNEQPPGTGAYRDRFYLNEKGRFILQAQAIPELLVSKSCVKAADFDGDGDLDVFVGGRNFPQFYPKSVSSYLLRNDTQNGTVKFIDITAQAAPSLIDIGMICDALWTDFDNDGDHDLLLAGEWMPLTLLRNDKGKLVRQSGNGLDQLTGWWNSLAGADFDNDGDIDYIAGNFGLNSLFRPTAKRPVRLYSADFDKNGSYDAIPTAYFPDDAGVLREFPFFGRDDMIKQMISIKARFTSYKAFASAGMVESLGADTLKTATVHTANFLASAYVENKGNGQFEVRQLPPEAQYSPVFGILADDVDDDGNVDVLLVGNDYGTEVMTGRQDASYGLLLKGKGNGQFEVLNFQQSGWFVPEDAKALVQICGANGQPIYVASRNRNTLLTFHNRISRRKEIFPAHATAALLNLNNGKTRRHEQYIGSSFLSQSSRYMWPGASVKKINFLPQKQ
jgi:hypothetical protein